MARDMPQQSVTVSWESKRVKNLLQTFWDEATR